MSQIIVSKREQYWRKRRKKNNSDHENCLIQYYTVHRDQIGMGTIVKYKLIYHMSQIASVKLLSEKDAVPKLIQTIHEQQLYLEEHRGSRFQNKWFQELHQSISKQKHKNLKRKLLKKLLKDCQVCLNSKQQGKISERTFFQYLEDASKIQYLEKLFQTWKNYIEILIDFFKTFNTVERILGICFLMEIKDKLFTFKKIPQTMDKFIQGRERGKNKLSDFENKLQTNFQSELSQSKERKIKEEQQQQQSICHIYFDFDEKKDKNRNSQVLFENSAPQDEKNEEVHNIYEYFYE